MSPLSSPSLCFCFYLLKDKININGFIIVSTSIFRRVPSQLLVSVIVFLSYFWAVNSGMLGKCRQLWSTFLWIFVEVFVLYYCCTTYKWHRTIVNRMALTTISDINVAFTLCRFYVYMLMFIVLQGSARLRHFKIHITQVIPLISYKTHFLLIFKIRKFPRYTFCREFIPE